MAREKTLGTDGLPVEFYTIYVEQLAPKLADLYGAAREGGKTAAHCLGGISDSYTETWEISKRPYSIPTINDVKHRL